MHVTEYSYSVKRLLEEVSQAHTRVPVLFDVMLVVG